MTSPTESWRPAASRATLETRAALLARARAFFAERGVLEVETPIVVRAPVTDVHIESASVRLPAADAALRYLRTSPEYAMKRLLAAGSGDIYQICRVVRGFERGRLHNPEFTLIEWYRVGFTIEQLMDEVDALVRTLLGAAAGAEAERLTYREAFVRELGLDPLDADNDKIAAVARARGLASVDAARDELLEFLSSEAVGPRLGLDGPTFLHRYPASQAALARLDPADPRVALRFELYRNGIELANGFDELASASEQRARFMHDLEERRRRGLESLPIDERLLAALEEGLPPCCGVALGFDRLTMLATDAERIDDVLAFSSDTA